VSKSAKKPNIYNSDSKTEKSDANVKKRGAAVTTTTIANEEEELDDVQGFPIPEITPIKITNTSNNQIL
jgi:hypothetical protein